jgi:hypothetical protein
MMRGGGLGDVLLARESLVQADLERDRRLGAVRPGRYAHAG